MKRHPPGEVPAAAVRDQYENYPFPPLSVSHTTMQGITPCQADYGFARYYQRGPEPVSQALHASKSDPSPQALHILDAGCGTGMSCLKLAELNPQATITAVELSENALTIAKQRIAQAGFADRVHFYQGDLQDPQLVEQLTRSGSISFDYLHCSGVIHHIPRPDLALRHLRQCLKPDALGYFMVYAGAARHEIQQIQDLVYLLWENPSDWQEGLLRCRALLAQLPVTHPLKQFHLRTRNQVKHLLGEDIANSDAFLVDTYLQRCEHLWSAEDWHQLLRANGFVPGRWLDEPSWDFTQYLPDFLTQFTLSPSRQKAVAEKLRPPHHLAQFVIPGHSVGPSTDLAEPPSESPSESPSKSCSAQDQPSIFSSLKHIPFRFKSIAALPQSSGAVINNQRGHQLPLTNWEYALWQRIDGQQDYQTLIKAQQLAFPEIDASTVQESLQRWAQYYCIGELLSGPTAING